MSALSVSPLTFRDLIQRIFPTIVAFCLFIPFIDSIKTVATLESVIFGGVILGYLIANPIRAAADSSIKRLPLFKKRFKECERRRKRVSDNWDYYRLHSYLTKDENEYIEQLGSQAIFDRVACFYLLLYLIANLIWLLSSFQFSLDYLPNMWSSEHWKKLLSIVFSVKTPMLGNWEAPTIFILIAIPVAIVFLLRDFLLHYDLIFFERGQYDIMADKYHREKGDIAVSIWGQVFINQKPAAGKTVKLLKSSSQISSDTTDESGYFQFKDKYKSCLGADCTVTVELGTKDFSEKKKFDEKTPPGFIFQLSLTPEELGEAPAPNQDHQPTKLINRFHNWLCKTLCGESHAKAIGPQPIKGQTITPPGAKQNGAETSTAKDARESEQKGALADQNSGRLIVNDKTIENNADTNKGLAAGTPAFKRIMLVANKKWEADPLMSVLLETKACPMKFDIPPETLRHPLPPNADWQKPYPRAVIRFKETVNDQAGNQKQIEVAQVEVWCLEDWMDPMANKSSTNEKIKILPGLFKWGGGPDPDFVAAFGTASFISQTSYNGCVVVGANAYIHNAFSKDSPNTESPWDTTGVEGPIKATLGAKSGFFNSKEIDASIRYQAEARFISPPLNPARNLLLIAAYNYTALGVVNVTNYDDSIWADRLAIKAFEAASTKNPIGSLETTHSVIRIQSDAPFIFISGIVDREDSFNMEVSARVYAQNLAGAHNAGVVAAWLLPRIVDFVRKPVAKA